MVKSVYVVGGAGTGKSTFMAQLMDIAVSQAGPLEDLHARQNAKALVTLRGHRLDDYFGRSGIYLGRMRESFPGTDGLDRASSATGVEWLERGMAGEFDFLLAEGATLATRPFLTALHNRTDLLLVHLFADDFVKELRFFQRKSTQDSKFVLATATRSVNLLRDMVEARVDVLNVDTANPDEWAFARKAALEHIS